ncbi:MAG: winged helix-turn-helix domain-containing protein [Fimbriimonadaceae bacterium]|nr:winged helix-turn-helix domain-containing protein [Fimbriimonadaceae bacterium]
MPDKLTVVVIEDEAPIRRFLKASVPEGSHDWHECDTGADGLKAVAKAQPDLVLLDLGLPDMSGLDVLKSLREWTQVPVIVLTARGQERDKVSSLDGGADDYMTKPFSVNELWARVRVVLRRVRRSQVPELPVYERKGLVLDFEAHRVTLNGEEVRLTPIEYKLLGLLCRNAGKVLTHKVILAEVWGQGYEDSTHTLRVHMGALRAKIERDPGHPTFIRTETGVGYRFLDD